MIMMTSHRNVFYYFVKLSLLLSMSCSSIASESKVDSATLKPTSNSTISNATTPSLDIPSNITLTTTEIVNSKNETLHTLAQNQYNLGPGGSPFGNSPLPPQLIAALQRRQQLLSQQNGGRPINPLDLIRGFLPGGPAALQNLSPLQRQQLQQQFLRQQQLLQRNNQRQQQNGVNGAGRTSPSEGNQEDEGNANSGGEDNEGQGEGEGNSNSGEQQENPQDDPDLKQLQRLQGGNNGDNFIQDNGGSLFEGLFPPGILSAADIKDIEKGIEDQRKKEEEEKRQKEAEEQAAREEEERQNQAANEENNSENNGQEGHNQDQPNAINNNNNGHSDSQPHQHGNHVHPPHGQQNLPNHLSNGQPYPQNPGQTGGYPHVQPQLPAQGGYGQQQPPLQQNPLQPQLPYNPLQQQPPVTGGYPGLTQPGPQYPGQQFIPQGINPFGTGGIPGLSGIPSAGGAPGGGIPGLGQINPALLSQVNPAILSQLNPALLQQYQQLQRNQQLNGGQGLPNLNQLIQLNQLRNQQNHLNNRSPGYSNPLTPLNPQPTQPPPPPFRPASLPIPSSPDSGYTNGRGTDYGNRDSYNRPRDPYSQDNNPRSPTTTPYPSIGNLLRGAGRALGIPGLGGPGDDPTSARPGGNQSPRSAYRQRDPQAYDPNRDYSRGGTYDRPDDRRRPYSPGTDDYRGSSPNRVDYDADRDDRRSPYRDNYHRQRERTPVTQYVRSRDTERQPALTSGVDYRENDVDDDRNAEGSSRPADSGYRGSGGYREEEEEAKRQRGGHRDRIRFRDKVGEISYRDKVIDDKRQSQGGSHFDDETDHYDKPRRLNPFVLG